MAAFGRGGGRTQADQGGGKAMDRYPSRVFICAFMVLGQPDTVFSAYGPREKKLEEAAMDLVPRFETLLGWILEGGAKTQASSPSASPSPSPASHVSPSAPAKSSPVPSGRGPFAVHLAAFDAAWVRYLECMVAWKVPDVRQLEEELVGMACQMEESMLLRAGGLSPSLADLSQDSTAVRQQVASDHLLLRDKLRQVAGTPAVNRMEAALTDVRTRFAASTPQILPAHRVRAAGSPGGSGRTGQGTSTGGRGQEEGEDCPNPSHPPPPPPPLPGDCCLHQKQGREEGGGGGGFLYPTRSCRSCCMILPGNFPTAPQMAVQKGKGRCRLE